MTTPDFPPRLNADPFDPQPWAEDALCRQEDPEAWFPGIGEHGYMVRVVKAICTGCRVRVDCLQYALDATDRLEGIWGGTTRKEREPMRTSGISALDVLYPIDQEEEAS